MFLLTAGEHICEHDVALLEVARQMGVQHIVKLSVMGAGHGSQDPITLWHKTGEEAIKASGIAWTFLRPGGFMSNTLRWAYPIKNRGIVYAPFSSDKVAIVDPYDIAAIAACALTQAGHEGKVYDISGPEALSITEQVEVLAKALEKPIQVVEVRPLDAQKSMELAGLSAILADAVIQTLSQAKDDFSAQVLPTVRQVTLRDPRSFEQWVKVHLKEFIN